MIKKQIRSFVGRLMTQEQSPRKLAFTCALGIYIGISPFPGLHTVMTLLFAWVFSVNLAVLFAVSVLVSNPWTMVPVYTFDHLFGTWLLRLLHIDYVHYDPVWMESVNLFFKEHIGISGLSPLAFLVGGNALAIGMSVISYPLLRRMFAHYYSNKQLIDQQ
jgi:uncharacterized protein (DUF2062 family)